MKPTWQRPELLTLKTLDAVMCEHIKEVLTLTNFNMSMASKLLNVNRARLYRMCINYGLLCTETVQLATNSDKKGPVRGKG